MLEVRTARNENEVDRAYELAAGIFGPDYAESLSHKHLVRSLEPLEDLRDVVLVADGEKLLGFIRIINRNCYSIAGDLKIGGITSVCTHPDLRGQGWGIRLMEGALKRSQERKDDFSLLFSRRVITGWYSKIGYVGIGCKSEVKLDQIQPVMQATSTSIEIRSGIDRSFLRFYADAHKDSYSGLPLAINRTEQWWDNLEGRLEQHRIGSENFINVMIGETPVGYYIKAEDQVIEAASLDEFRVEFLSGMLDHCQASKEVTASIALPPGHWCLADLPGGRDSKPTPELSWNHSQMVRILNKEAFREIALKACSPEEFRATQDLFKNADVESHDGARRLLATMVAQDPVYPPGGYQELPASPTVEQWLLPSLPYWSPLDEI
jgi:predicted acetyltransferase